MHGYPLYSEAATALDDPEWVPFARGLPPASPTSG